MRWKTGCKFLPGPEDARGQDPGAGLSQPADRCGRPRVPPTLVLQTLEAVTRERNSTCTVQLRGTVLVSGTCGCALRKRVRTQRARQWGGGT